MSWRVLPPAGHPVALAGDKSALPEFTNYRAFWVQSGTAALALAMIAARRRAAHIENPQVILPGYACPDLVAAAIFAGVQPVLADIGSDDPAYDLNALRAAISPATVAIVAVNFLGVSERLSSLREIISMHSSRGAHPSMTLIEDNAQWFPEPLPNAPLQGDCVCVSFGRGKPVSLLGGGVLLMNAALDIPDIADVIHSADAAGISFAAKALAYNALLSPWLYGPVSRLPFLKLGITQLKTLSAIQAMAPQRLALLNTNIQKYLRRSHACADAIGAALPDHIIDLRARAGERAGRLLRYPVLLRNRQSRDIALQKLQCAGLGATALYQSVLPDIDGVSAHARVSGDLNGARQFAERLLTLPVHEGVSAADVKKIGRLLRD